MLLSLNIKNAALISSLKLDFDKGLNILSGETGAGKSIIIDSLSFALGSKSDKSLIRHNESFMSAEAVFSVDGEGVQSFLKEAGFEDEAVIIYRALTVDGKSEIRINGRACTLSMLKELTSRLADIYGQSEHISLLKPSTHINFLDGYGKKEITSAKEEISGVYGEYKKVISALKGFGGSERERERLADLYRYQIEEIENAKLNENEEEELTAKRNLLINIEKITEDAGEALKSLEGGDFNALSSISDACSLISRCAKYDGELEAVSSRLESARIEVEDITSNLSAYINSLDYDVNEADKIEKRLDTVKNLKRKYGKNIAEILSYLNNAKSELQKLDNSTEEIAALNAKKQHYEAVLYNLSKNLSALRKKYAEKLEGEVLSNLADLSMGGSGFKVMFSDFPDIDNIEGSITAGGMDTVEFYISPNKGEPLKPLAKIISGGEMSRFMLALKSILSETDETGTLVFDEIDTGISGFTATAVAKKFAAISKKQQIIAITHLPQIAAMADSGYVITKRQEDGKTQTFVNRLDEEEKANEVARLIGAADIGTHAGLHAKDLIKWSDGYKNQIK